MSYLLDTKVIVWLLLGDRAADRTLDAYVATLWG